MKRVIINILIIMLLLAISSLTSYSQEYRISEQLTSLTLSGETTTFDIGFEALEVYNFLKIRVTGYMKKGEIFVELVDPSGYVSKATTVKSGPLNWNRFPRYLVQGVVEQAFQNPVTGHWFIRISSKDGEGELRLFWKQIKNPGEDLLDPDQLELETISYFW